MFIIFEIIGIGGGGGGQIEIEIEREREMYVSFLSTILFRNNVLACNYFASCLRDELKCLHKVPVVIIFVVRF